MKRNPITAAILAGALTSTTAWAADSAPATLIDAASLGWATICQQSDTASNSEHSTKPILGNCPITMREAVKEWNYLYNYSAVTFSDRLASRDMPEWVKAWQEGSLKALAEHLRANGFDEVRIETHRSGITNPDKQAARSAAQTRIEKNAGLPKLQREPLGLIVVAGEPWIQVEYEGEIENPNPYYDGWNPLKSMASAVTNTGNGPFVFDGVAHLTAGQELYLFNEEGELLDVREAQAQVTTGDIHLSMDDVNKNTAYGTYAQDMEIREHGKAMTESEYLEDNRYERFKAAFAELGDRLSTQVPGLFDDLDRIREAAGI